MSITATNLIYSALADLGVLRPGQTASTDTKNDGLTVLNQIIDSWQLDRLMSFATRVDTYTLVTGTTSYTIGNGAMFDTTSNGGRPVEVRAANIITSSPTARKQLDIIGVDEWSGIMVQAMPNGIPSKLYYDQEFDSNGYGKIYLWEPPANTWQLELFTRQQIQTFADLTTTYTFPPAYQRALQKSLAASLAPRMALQFKASIYVTPAILQANIKRIEQEAEAARAQVQRYNAPREDPALALARLQGQLTEAREAVIRAGKLRAEAEQSAKQDRTDV